MLLASIRTSLRSTAPATSRLMSTTRAVRSPVGVLSPQELHSLLSDRTGKGKDLVVLDGSWFMPNLDPPRFGFKEFRTKRIENAGFWDLDLIASKSDVGVPHNMPTKSQFEDAASRLGISRDSHVVVYDSTGVFSSPRTAFTFKHFNHDKVSILDGGLARWEAEKLPIDTSIPSHVNPHDLEQAGKKFHPIFSELIYATKPRIESYFIADIEEHFTEYRVDEGAEKQGDVLEWEDMNSNIEKGEQGDIVLDARPSGRFDGTAPEPRAGLSSGHMPFSFNLPSTSVLSPESSTTPPYKTLLSKDELERVFKRVIGDENWELVKKGERRVINTCGSGMTAAILWLALQQAGASEKVAIYDESWTGYASREKSKIVKSTK
ncbi:hypothetical protein JCM11491_004851 [Sporobolomyces phaffii]